ncbi:uncharacterized protein LOC131425525 [Malaya genurostris]|uniref:uncharacterized protein LOC131425525 n=1 Tax=Malaya genurostris TaxID=325434 RepID=UPI0026F3BDBB|nr:uncharacterized protein LOC131425525 [Malaya genurostris]
MANLVPPPIDDLPDEMLRKIFSYLWFKELTTVATICHRWYIVTESLIIQKAQVVVDLREDTEKELYYTLLQSSLRPLKQLLLYPPNGSFFRFEIDDRDKLICGILGKLGAPLETFILRFNPLDENPYARLELFSSVARFCPKLQVLRLEGTYFFGTYSGIYHVFPLLQELHANSSLLECGNFNLKTIAPNMTRLHVNNRFATIKTLSYYPSQLTELSIDCENGATVGQLGMLFFPRLKKFRVRFLDRVNNVDGYNSFLRKHDALEEVALAYNIDVVVLDSLQSSRKTLKRLSFETPSLTVELFTRVSSFECLEMLQVANAEINFSEFFFNRAVVPAIKTSIRLLNLRMVNIVNHELFSIFVRHSFPALKTLELIQLSFNLTNCEIRSCYQRMLCHLVPLERLTLCSPFIHIDAMISRDMLSCLSTLTSLRELRFSLGCPKIPSYLDSDITVPGIQKMVVKGKNKNILPKLIKAFPGLRRLETSRESNFLCLDESTHHCEIVSKRDIIFEIFPTNFPALCTW